MTCIYLWCSGLVNLSYWGKSHHAIFKDQLMNLEEEACLSTAWLHLHDKLKGNGIIYDLTVHTRCDLTASTRHDLTASTRRDLMASSRCGLTSNS